MNLPCENEEIKVWSGQNKLRRGKILQFLNKLDVLLKKDQEDSYQQLSGNRLSNKIVFGELWFQKKKYYLI